LTEIKIKKIDKKNKSWVKKFLKTRWGSSFVLTRGKLHYYDKLDGFIAEADGKNKGLITYKIKGRSLEIVSLDSLLEDKGIGAGLISRVIEFAKEAELERVWLITTNDNIDAIKFYQQRGLRAVKVYPGAVDISRKIKPAIPEVGNYGIPIRDEIEFEMKLK